MYNYLSPIINYIGLALGLLLLILGIIGTFNRNISEILDTIYFLLLIIFVIILRDWLNIDSIDGMGKVLSIFLGLTLTVICTYRILVIL